MLLLTCLDRQAEELHAVLRAGRSGVMLTGQVFSAAPGKRTGEIHVFLHTPSQCQDSLMPFFLNGPESEPYSPLSLSV